MRSGPPPALAPSLAPIGAGGEEVMSLGSIKSRAYRHLLDPLVERATANARELPKAGGELGEK